MKDLKDIKDLSNGHTIQELEPDKQAKYYKDFAGIPVRSLRINPGGWFLPEGYLQFEERYSNFKFRPSDVVIMTYPKCGTTWTQEIVWTMRNNPNLDNPDAETALFTRSPFIELDMLTVDRDLSPQSEVPPMVKDFFERCPEKDLKDGMMLQMVEAINEPRTLKTHLPFSLLPKDLLDSCKVIYVARNPKDALLSYQHHCRLMKGYGFVGSQDDFVQYFVDDMVDFCPFGEHVKEAWRLRTHPNLHIVFYEDMKKDIRREIQKIADYIGVNLSDQQMKNVMEKTSFKEMQATDPTKMMVSKFFNEDVQKRDGTFFRQGEAGSWRGKFTPEQEAKVDVWIEKNFAGSDIVFKY